MSIQFELTPEQEAKFLAWKTEQDKKSALRQLANLSPEALQERRNAGFSDDEPYAGAIGGIYTFKFTATGLGVVAKVHCGLTEEELDLTDYENW